MRTWTLAGRVWLPTVFLAVFSGNAASQEIAYGRLLVKFKPGTSVERASRILGTQGGRMQREIPHIGVQIVTLPERANPIAVANAMEAFGEVEYAEPDRIAHGAQLQEPNDPYYASGYQGYLKIVRAIQAWTITRGVVNVPIAVLDSGVNVNHLDFVGQTLPGWNSYDGTPDVTDNNGHGTAVSGVACAASNNGIGVASVAPGCKLIPVKIESPAGVAYYSTMASGLIWAADHGARVCNISYSALDGNSTLHRALENLNSRGVVVVGAAGNQGIYTGLPNDPFLITVGATDSAGVHCGYSNYGENVDISAFGIDWTTSSNGGYLVFSGTSCATPYVSGAAALVLSANPNLSPSQVEGILKSTAYDLGETGWDPYYGSGFINIEAAVQKAIRTVPVDTTTPLISIDSPAAGSTISGAIQVWATASDNNAVDKVSFHVDGSLVCEVTTEPYTFTWDASRAIPGSHEISAIVHDTASNTGQASVNVNVSGGADTSAPQVRITSPADGSKLSRNVKVSVNAADNVGVVKTELYLDGTLVASSTSAPFGMQFSTRNLSPGRHTLLCRAYDAAKNVGLSQTITVSK